MGKSTISMAIFLSTHFVSNFIQSCHGFEPLLHCSHQEITVAPPGPREVRLKVPLSMHWRAGGRGNPWWLVESAYVHDSYDFLPLFSQFWMDGCGLIVVFFWGKFWWARRLSWFLQGSVKISQGKLHSFVNALDRINAEPCKLNLILASEPKSAEVILHAAAFRLKTFRTHLATSTHCGHSGLCSTTSCAKHKKTPAYSCHIQPDLSFFSNNVACLGQQQCLGVELGRTGVPVGFEMIRWT